MFFLYRRPTVRLPRGGTALQLYRVPHATSRAVLSAAALPALAVALTRCLPTAVLTPKTYARTIPSLHFTTTFSRWRLSASTSDPLGPPTYTAARTHFPRLPRLYCPPFGWPFLLSASHAFTRGATAASNNSRARPPCVPRVLRAYLNTGWLVGCSTARLPFLRHRGSCHILFLF